MTAPTGITFEHVGIGAALMRYRLKVPLNQREYAWEEKQVTELFQDFSAALSSNKKAYFLGTIVLTIAEDSGLEVVDGQQRLATTTILLAAIRDWLCGKKTNDAVVTSIEQEFLFKIDRKYEELLPRLTLNVTDNDYFAMRILPRPNDIKRQASKPTRSSHERINTAADLAAEHVDNIVKQFSAKNRVAQLKQWIDFIEKTAQIILLTAADDLNAFVMFETLNDRGLRVAQSDLLKNYLFGESDDRLKDAQQKWATMNGVLEGLGVEDITMTYLRHLVISRYGHTRERGVAEKIKTTVSGKTPAIDFIDTLADGATDYVAIVTPNHSKWNIGYRPTIRECINTLNILRVAPLRPLMLSISRRFSAKEIDKTFRLLVSWSVRILVVGGGRSSKIEEGCAELARKVSDKEINTAAELAVAANGLIPGDVAFQAEFETVKVTVNALARYYLRALELHKQGNAEPELVPNEAVVINLEHVLPENPVLSEWVDFDAETAALYWRRLGNMVLLQATKNNDIANSSFSLKKPILRDSAYYLTSEVGRQTSWSAKKIAERQKRLAALAVATWPITVS